MKIIQATSYYLVDVLFLLRECIADMNSRGLKQWNSANPTREEIVDDLNKGTLYLYTENAIARGIIKLSEDGPKEYDEIKWKGDSSKVLYLSKFAVHPVWLDSDICIDLIEFAEKFAKENGYTSMRLDILDNYPVDAKFYTGRQFDSAGSFHSDFQKKPYTCFEKNL